MHRKTVLLLSLLTLMSLLTATTSHAQARWNLEPDGGIVWKVNSKEPHQDQIEMSGRKVSVIVSYGLDAENKLQLEKLVVFPTLRTIPNNTHGSLLYTFGTNDSPRIFIDGKPSTETIVAFRHRGLMTVQSTLGRNRDVALERTIFPSTNKPLVLEKYQFTNRSPKDVTIELENTEKVVRTAPERGVEGQYLIEAQSLNTGVKTLHPGEQATFTVAFSARLAGEPPLAIDTETEEKQRRARVSSFFSELQLQTPDPVLNTAFDFAKIRATESIYETRGGLMHSPGGGRYYAAIWANDQAEYANPFFAFLGDEVARKSALNSFRWFAKYMNPEYKPIPSSIVAEGKSTWHGAGDRGDMAMIAYGAARFALANGDKDSAQELWPLIEWCLEYCRRQINEQGVVASKSDELEGRFPAGKANLATSSLYYDALNSAALLGRDLGQPDATLVRYRNQAEVMRAAIDKYFGATVEGFETYRYYEGNDVLRSWICIPLTMGIFERKNGTINALFSPRLWTPDGLATQAGDTTFWDRSTLYGLRGAFAAGETQKTLDFLTRYTNRRLLGEHVPYPVEAYPEGNQRHLAAESALYCRIYTEGLFGIRPTGLRSFSCIPRLPAAWNTMQLRNIHAFGQVFDLLVARNSDGLNLQVRQNGKITKNLRAPEGQALPVAFPL